jgi:nucleoside-diphosphate-sugar epimerase
MILVTGGSGFLGMHLVQYLSAMGKPVRALYHTTPPSQHLASLPGIEWMQCDLLDVFAVEEAMQGVTDIYHCAAIVTFSPHLQEQMLHFNPESTANIVNQAIEQGIRKLVHVSSVAALGRSGDEKKEITEEQEWAESKYNSAYGISKYLAENEVWRGIGEGLNAVIINPSVILGAGDWGKGSAQLMSVANSEFPFYTHGVSGWVDVADVVRAMAMLMSADTAEERYIINSGNHGFREVFTLMAKALGKKPPRYAAGSFITGILWRLSAIYSLITRKNVTITRETADTATGHSYYNNEKFLKDFPDFAYTPITESIYKMAQAFKKNAVTA